MRRAEVDPLHLIVAAVILLIAMVVIIFIFRGMFAKEANITSENIGKVGSDSDGDGVMDLFDFCPFNSKIAKKEDALNGNKDDCKPCISKEYYESHKAEC